MSRKPSPLGQVQQKIAVTILPEDFGAKEQEVKDCLAGLAAHEELCRERSDFDGWVNNRITDAMDAARAVGKAAREEREGKEAATVLEGQVKGLAEHYGLNVEAVEAALELAEGEADDVRGAAKKAKNKK